MKQIVDKLNKIAKKIDESVEIPQTDLIIDSLDAITKAYGGTPNDSHLIVDKLEDIASVAHSGITPTGNIEITENTAEGEPLDVSQYATATVNVAGGGGETVPKCVITFDNTTHSDNYGVESFINGVFDITPIPAGETVTANCLYHQFAFGGSDYVVSFGMKNGYIGSSSSVSNLQNLTLSEDGFLIVTDPTEDSSVTIDAAELAVN